MAGNAQKLAEPISMHNNVTFDLYKEVREGEKMTTLQDLLDIQRKANQQLCLSFNKARQEMIAALKVAH